MRLPHFRVRTLMLAVGVVAFLIWGAMMASKSFVYYQRAREYGETEQGWRRLADKPGQPGGQKFRLECVEYFAMLAAKYRRAMWHPWSSVAPDPHAPGYDQWLEQENRKKKLVTDSLTPGASSTPK